MEVGDVEKLKHENKVMKLEIQRLMQSNTHQNFHKGGDMDITQNHNLNMTDYENEQDWQDQSDHKAHLENGMMFEKHGVTPSIDTENTPIQDQKHPKMIESLTSFKESNHVYNQQQLTNGSEMFPSLTKPPLSRVLEKTSSPPITNENTSAGTQASNLNSFQMGASYLKENLSKKGRCPICTLPLPCKHYQSVDELPKVEQSKYYLPPANARGVGVSVAKAKKQSHKTTRESSIQPSMYNNEPLMGSNMGDENQHHHHFESEHDRGKLLSHIYVIFIGSKRMSGFNSPKQEFKEYDFNRQLPTISSRANKMESFLNSEILENRKKKNKSTVDYSIFYGGGSSKQVVPPPQEAKVRIRGKSNILSTQGGS